MKIPEIFFALLTIVLIAACSTTYVIRSDYEKDINYAAFKTYNILNHDHGFPQGANPINKQRIERAIHKEVGALGFEKSEDPDLEVSWFVKVANVKGVDVDMYREYYGQWYLHPYRRVYEYREGTLVVDIIDRANRQVVWHGKTTDRVYENMENLEEKINKAVNAMFVKFAEDAKLGNPIAVH